MKLRFGVIRKTINCRIINTGESTTRCFAPFLCNLLLSRMIHYTLPSTLWPSNLAIFSAIRETITIVYLTIQLYPGESRLQQNSATFLRNFPPPITKVCFFLKKSRIKASVNYICFEMALLEIDLA